MDPMMKPMDNQDMAPLDADVCWQAVVGRDAAVAVGIFALARRRVA